MADKAILELGLKSFLSEAEFLENKKGSSSPPL